MKDKIKEILVDVYQIDGRHEDEAAERILRLFDVGGRSEQLCQCHDWVKNPSHPKIGAMICRNCGTELA